MSDAAHAPELIVMLTHNDRTVDDALEVFHSCEGVGVTRWGFKDVGPSTAALRELGAAISEAGCSLYLEIVSLGTADALAAVEVAHTCSCDVVMGSLYSPVIQEAVQARGLRYMPFAGEVSSHPSVLDGAPEAIVEEVQQLGARGVDGIDLLAFRYRGDAEALLADVVRASAVPVVSAGSIASFERIGLVWDAGAWGFTVGSALFERAFDPAGSFRANVERVCSWLAAETARRVSPNGGRATLDGEVST